MATEVTVVLNGFNVFVLCPLHLLLLLYYAVLKELSLCYILLQHAFNVLYILYVSLLHDLTMFVLLIDLLMPLLLKRFTLVLLNPFCLLN